MPSSDLALRIRLLGPLEILAGERRVVVDTRKALAIVALVAAEGRPFAREELAAMFWPDADDEAARGALRRTLSALRTAVGERGLRIDRTRVGVDPDAAWVDLADVERLAGSSEPADLEAAAGLARGPFLAGFSLRDSPAFDDWHAARASRVERTVGELLERLAGVRLGAGDTSGAVEASRRRVELDPLDEGGQRRLIEILGRTGDRAGAIGQYRALVALLDRELGVPPLRETTALYDAVREGTFEPKADILPIASPDVPVDAEGPPKASIGGLAEASPGERRRLPLVGRDVELHAVVSAWRDIGPDGRLAIVEGEAGIGKTRFLEAVAASIGNGGGTVLGSRGYEGEATIAYGPIAELLRAGMALPGGIERLAELGDGVRLEIGRLVDLPPPLRVASSSLPDPASGRVRLVEAIAVALSALAGGSIPGLISIDDFHLVDAPTREVAAYLARRLASRPILFLLAWRREDLAPDALATAHDLARTRDARVISLGRLDRAAVTELVHAARPEAVRDPTIDDVVATLLDESEGLPLHVVEALATGEVADAEGRRGVHAIIRDRIASVTETTAQVLSAAAVIGRSFDFGTVRAASGRSEEETVLALEELARRGIVRELSGAAGAAIRYDFGHGRLRDTAYEMTSLARRRLLHRRVADALRVDASGAARDEVGRFALIATHEREGGRPQAAVAAYLEAADRAESVFANAEAIDNLEAALALDPSAAAHIHERIGQLRARLGDYPAAIRALETAAALAPPEDLPAIEVALGRVHRRRGDLAAAASHLEWALASLGPGVAAAASPTDALRAQAQIERSLVALRTGDLDAADAAARDALDAAARASDRHLAGVGERLVGLVAQARGDVAAARSALERSLSLAVDDPDPTAFIAASTALALTLAAAGSVDEAIGTAVAAVEACRRIGDRHLEAAVENHVADICHEAGRTEESMAHLKRAVALFVEIGEGAPESDPGIWALAAW